jgi:hypothetical protein
MDIDDDIACLNSGPNELLIEVNWIFFPFSAYPRGFILKKTSYAQSGHLRVNNDLKEGKVNTKQQRSLWLPSFSFWLFDFRSAARTCDE